MLRILVVISFVPTQDQVFYDHAKKMFDGFKELGAVGQQALLSQMKGASYLYDMLQWSRSHPRSKSQR